MKNCLEEQPIKRGQLWQLKGSQVRIVEVGRSLVHFKHLVRAKQKGISVQLQKITDMQEMLRTRGAKLVAE